MGILDEAIREHLELKRKHGAQQEELRQLEDEAFGPAGRPAPESEAAPSEGEAAETQVLSQIPAAEEAGEGEPEAEAEAVVPEAELDEASQREAIAQQPTEVFDVASELAREKGEERGSDEIEVETEASAETETPAEVEAEAPAEAEAQAEASQESPAGEAETPAEAAEAPEAVAEAPEATVEAPIDAPADEALGGDAEPAAEAVPEAPAAEEVLPEELFDESSLSEELDQALEGPLDREQRRAAFFEETDEFHAPPQRPAREPEHAPAADPFPETSEEDLLGDTPDFLEETPEHDRLWFEQKPPKDFDFND